MATILCGVDASPAGRHAVYVAAGLAHRYRAGLTLAHADREPAAVSAVAALADDVAPAVGARPSVHAGTGPPAAALRAAAHATDADLLVVGQARRDRLGDALLGETPRELILHAPCPVMLVPAGTAPATGDGLLLVCEPAAPSLTAAATAGRLAASLGASRVLLVVVRDRRAPIRVTGWQVYDATRRMTDVVRRLARRPVDVEVVDAGRRSAAALAALATERRAAMVVAGALRRHAWGAVARGSAATDLARRAGLPVVVAAGPAAFAGRPARTAAARRARLRAPAARDRTATRRRPGRRA
jgi:nucleotide-binding universal stress UspA family protein